MLYPSQAHQCGYQLCIGDLETLAFALHAADCSYDLSAINNFRDSNRDNHSIRLPPTKSSIWAKAVWPSSNGRTTHLKLSAICSVSNQQQKDKLEVQTLFPL